MLKTAMFAMLMSALVGSAVALVAGPGCVTPDSGPHADAEPAEAQAGQSLICSPWCDDDYTGVLHDAFAFGYAKFPFGVAGDNSCADLSPDDGGPPDWECTVRFTSSRGLYCGTFAVSCFHNRCTWATVGGCPE